LLYKKSPLGLYFKRYVRREREREKRERDKRKRDRDIASPKGDKKYYLAVVVVPTQIVLKQYI
jgi:hypothetical protein